LVKEDVSASGDIPVPYKDGLRTLAIAQDLSVQNAADLIHMQTEEAGCEVEVLVNNAGIMYCQGIAETSERMLKLIMMVHCYTSLMLCRK
jgi:short-subunit dehydrogenase